MSNIFYQQNSTWEPSLQNDALANLKSNTILRTRKHCPVNYHLPVIQEAPTTRNSSLKR